MSADKLQENCGVVGVPFKQGDDPRRNLAGRPKGKTLKEWVREKLAEMPIEQREEFIKDIPKDIVWKMAEGNPNNESKMDITSRGEKITAINYILPDGDNSAPNQETTPSIPGAEQS